MHLLSCLLSLLTLLSAKSTHPSASPSPVNDAQDVETCREICRELRRQSIEEYLPSVLENINLGVSEQDALSNAQRQATNTLNLLQVAGSTSSGSHLSQIFRGEFEVSARKLLNDLKNRWYTIFYGQQPTVDIDVFECNAHNRALDKGKKWLQKQHEKYDCPDCNELLANENAIDRCMIIN